MFVIETDGIIQYSQLMLEHMYLKVKLEEKQNSKKRKLDHLPSEEPSLEWNVVVMVVIMMEI